MSGGARQITCFVLFQIRFHGTAPWPNVAYVSRGHGESNPCDKPGTILAQGYVQRAKIAPGLYVIHLGESGATSNRTVTELPAAGACPL